MKTIIYFFLISILAINQVCGNDRTLEKSQDIKSQIKNLLNSVDKKGNIKDELFLLPETNELRKLCPANWNLVLENWDELKGQKEDDSKSVLFLSFLCEPSQFSSVKVIMEPGEYILFLEEALLFFKNRNSRDAYFELARNGRYLSLNYTYPEASKLLKEIIETSEEWKRENERAFFSEILDGKYFFEYAQNYNRPNPDGSEKILFRKWVIDDEFKPGLMYLMFAYSTGATFAEMKIKSNRPGPIKRPTSNDFVSESAIYKHYRESEVKLFPVNNDMQGVPYPVKDEDYLSFSYSAELYLLDILFKKQISLPLQLMIVDVLWYGLYAEDQVERFLPMLVDSDEKIRERAFARMPDFLKTGIKFDPIHKLPDKEFEKMKEQVLKNLSRDSSLLSVDR